MTFDQYVREAYISQIIKLTSDLKSKLRAFYLISNEYHFVIQFDFIIHKNYFRYYYVLLKIYIYNIKYIKIWRNYNIIIVKIIQLELNICMCVCACVCVCVCVWIG